MRSLFLAAAVVVAFAGTARAEGTFIGLQTPSAQTTKISQNGEYLAAFVGGTGGVRWIRDTGEEQLVQGMDYSNGINNLGTVSGAIPVDGGSGNGGHDIPAVVALDATEPEPLPLPDGTDNANVYDVADDGSAVGLAWSDDFSVAKAYYWTPADGAIDLPVTDTTTASRANSISADGTVIGGWNDDPDTGFRRGVIWQDRVPFYPLDAMGNNVGEAGAVSGNGQFVVGSSYSNEDGSISSWRWSAKTGEVIPIPVMPFAFGVSDDGKTIVGASGFFDDPPRAAYIWTEANGSQLLVDYLAAQGITVPAGWDFSGGLTGVSGDGLVISGWTLFSPDGMRSFVVTIAPPDEIFVDGFDGAPAR